MSAPDRQRSKVYEAEALVRRILDRSVDHPIVDVAGSRLTLPPERKFASLESVQHYVDRVLALNWVAGRWPRAALPITVRARAGQERAHYERASCVIAVPLHRGATAWAMREMVVLHEIAHHLAADDESDHGPAFTGRMIDLVDGVVGPEVALLLRVTLLDVGARIG
ncbi:putative metallohydrolase, TIGR04338 family [Nakamurella panacisegetis]|uniref:Putative metallohydrolase, TIGR04338 family n=1 Tax=Nakamurella panacisegetis TaxID=1090615 RepID=A0A1H0SEM8_9ACTN|nr:TIGR04338 family metallohydrolase [Nakamurella panacisegetis]SDP39678.1 putative metallohydrolase, TIGR04338 family [Nakamurella panacisegetis]